MEFLIKVKHYSDGSYDYYIPTTAPIEGAVFHQRWNKEKRKRRWIVNKTPYAYVDENGSPQVGYTEERTENVDNLWDGLGSVEHWMKNGRNHSVDDNYYYREVEHGYWTIEVTTLEQLIKILREHDLTLEGSADSPVFELETYRWKEI